MRTHLSAALLFAAPFFFLFPLTASTIIISTDGQGNIGYGMLGGIDQAAGWSQISAYDDVSITAEIDPGTGSGTSGTAYLMTQIGTGTTTAEQIATASFSATGSAFTPVLNTLFTGLTLGPGNYFLVLSSSTGLGWEVATLGITPVTASAVSLIENNNTFGTTPDSYAPASNFSNVGGADLEFTVSGVPSAAAPEPSSLAIASLALAGIAIFRRRAHGLRLGGSRSRGC